MQLRNCWLTWSLKILIRHPVKILTHRNLPHWVWCFSLFYLFPIIVFLPHLLTFRDMSSFSHFPHFWKLLVYEAHTSFPIPSSSSRADRPPGPDVHSVLLWWLQYARCCCLEELLPGRYRTILQWTPTSSVSSDTFCNLTAVINVLAYLWEWLRNTHCTDVYRQIRLYIHFIHTRIKRVSQSWFTNNNDQSLLN